MMKKSKFPFPILCLLLIFWLRCPLSGCQNQENRTSQETSSLPTHYSDALYPSFSLSEAIDLSSTIVYGEITGVKSTYQETYEKLDLTQTYTPIEITPIQILKGESASPVLYNRLGGEYDGVLYRQEGDDITPAIGQKVIVFLDENSYDLGPNWALWEENGSVKYQDRDTHDLVEKPIEEYIQMVTDEISS